jgi:hypothetical protein
MCSSTISSERLQAGARFRGLIDLARPTISGCCELRWRFSSDSFPTSHWLSGRCRRKPECWRTGSSRCGRGRSLGLWGNGGTNHGIGRRLFSISRQSFLTRPMRDSKLRARWIRRALQASRIIGVEAAMAQASEAASQGMVECNTNWFVMKI